MNIIQENKIKNLTCLSENVKIYVPSTYNIDKVFSNDKQIYNTSVSLASRFGGATSYDTKGYYMSDKGTLVSENITVIQAFTSAINNDDKDFIIGIAENLKIEMDQEAVSIEINNKLYFI